MNPRETKQSVLDSIAARLGVRTWRAARGSTEPKAVFVEVIRRLGLAIPTSQRKPALGRAIAEAAGLDWTTEHDSTQTPSGGGDTVTLAGLQRVREAVQLLHRAAPRASAGDGRRGRGYVEEQPSTRSSPAVFERDPEAYDRSSNAHKLLQNRIAAAVERRGLVPLRWDPDKGDPPFDVAWYVRDMFVVCEVKSTTEANRVSQARLGMGQLFEYGARLAEASVAKVVLVLATELTLQEVQRRAAELARIALLAGATLESDLDALLARVREA